MFLFGGISINKLIIEWIDVKTKKSKANYAVTITVDLTKADIIAWAIFPHPINPIFLSIVFYLPIVYKLNYSIII